MYEQISAKDNKIIELSEEVVALKRQVWDLEEGLKEKDEIISARTAAVGLASASIAAKGLDNHSVMLIIIETKLAGRDTLEQLEDTRLELRRVQTSWSSDQAGWRREREEARIALESSQQKLNSLQDLSRRLEQSKEELAGKNQDLRQQITGLEEEVAMVKSRAREDKILLEARIEEVEEQKAAVEEKMIKKEEIFQEKLGKLRARKKGEKSRSVEERVGSLESALAEAEEEKGSLQLRLVELEDIAGEYVMVTL